MINPAGHLGDFIPGTTVEFLWSTYDAAGQSVARSVAGTVKVFDQSGASSTTGITQAADIDSATGVNRCTIDTSADPDFYLPGKTYNVVLKSATLDSQTVHGQLASFTIDLAAANSYVKKFADMLGNFGGDTLWVSPDGDDDDDGTDPHRPLATLEIACGAATEGTTIFLLPGEHTVDAIVVVPEGVSIRGAGPGRTTIAFTAGVEARLWLSNHCQLSNLTLSAMGHVDEASTIWGAVIVDGQQYGKHGIRISDVVGRANKYVLQVSGSYTASEVLLERCDFQAGVCAVHVDGGDGTRIVARDCQFEAQSGLRDLEDETGNLDYTCSGVEITAGTLTADRTTFIARSHLVGRNDNAIGLWVRRVMAHPTHVYLTGCTLSGRVHMPVPSYDSLSSVEPLSVSADSSAGSALPRVQYGYDLSAENNTEVWLAGCNYDTERVNGGGHVFDTQWAVKQMLGLVHFGHKSPVFVSDSPGDVPPDAGYGGYPAAPLATLAAAVDYVTTYAAERGEQKTPSIVLLPGGTQIANNLALPAYCTIMGVSPRATLRTTVLADGAGGVGASLFAIQGATNHQNHFANFSAGDITNDGAAVFKAATGGVLDLDHMVVTAANGSCIDAVGADFLCDVYATDCRFLSTGSELIRVEVDTADATFDCTGTTLMRIGDSSSAVTGITVVGTGLASVRRSNVIVINNGSGGATGVSIADADATAAFREVDIRLGGSGTNQSVAGDGTYFVAQVTTTHTHDAGLTVIPQIDAATVVSYATGMSPASQVLANPARPILADASGSVTTGLVTASALTQIAGRMMLLPNNKLYTDASGRVVAGLAANTVSAAALATDAVDEIAAAILATPSQKLVTDSSGHVTVGGASTAGKTAIAQAILVTASQKIVTDADGAVSVGAATTAGKLAIGDGVLVTPSQKIATNSSNQVVASSVQGNVTGSVGSVTAGVNLASTGLDSISMTAPSGVPTNFRQMLIMLYRRFFKKTIMTKSGNAGTIVTYADDGTTAITTQTIANTSTTQSQGPAA